MKEGDQTSTRLINEKDNIRPNKVSMGGDFPPPLVKEGLVKVSQIKDTPSLL